MSEDVAIKVENVSKNFVLPHARVNTVKSLFTSLAKGHRKDSETQHALENISFEIKKGEFFGIVGRNGSGKSTLLKILAGIYQPTSGGVHTAGKLVPFIELGVGFNPELTGRENVYLNGAMLGFSRKEIDSMYKDIVSFAELERFMDQKLKNYSSGMQVRLAFSMATRSEADILLVDEVLAVGDTEFQRKCFEYFRVLKKKKKTVVFVSHDMNAVREYCDRAVLIDESQIKFRGSAEDTAKQYTRLFMPVNEDDQDNDRQSWGSGDAKITDIKLPETLLTPQNEYLKIVVQVTSKKNFENELVPGLTVKNEAGQPICGTNSQIIRTKTVIPAKGDKITFTWQVPNIFNEGKFSMDLAIIDSSNNEICHWVDNAKSFRVINEAHTPYLVAPQILLTTEE